jgi:hypothetical protein
MDFFLDWTPWGRPNTRETIVNLDNAIVNQEFFLTWRTEDQKADLVYVLLASQKLVL